ncbi:regulatory protein, tetR family [Paramicrobacterium humi]|uniref:Regulatory protein, tetR family n=1 Tax=Paramicrobacterium humi TaxID=640635 RepID=A0A1H4IQH7_9MICO|nr:TetR family transcriptional regulator [Microbacterium humi]SEB36310.1 regulatory protein, tetR family [Microbacterium humi]
MSSRAASPLRDRALAAALELLGTDGLRAVTHARVDTAADLPAGSTSNYFRTRQALLTGLVERLAAEEQADFAAAQAPVDGESLIVALIGMLEAQSTRHRVRTRARYALFIDAANDAGALAPLLSARRDFEAWTTRVLRQAGAVNADEATRLLMAGLDGLLLHRITVDPDAALERPMRALVRACLELSG